MTTILEKLRELNQRRTLGHWWIDASGTGPDDTREILGVVGHSEIMVASIHAWNEADAEFIAAAANHMGALLDVVDKLQIIKVIATQSPCNPGIHTVIEEALKQLEKSE